MADLQVLDISDLSPKQKRRLDEFLAGLRADLSVLESPLELSENEADLIVALRRERELDISLEELAAKYGYDLGR